MTSPLGDRPPEPSEAMIDAAVREYSPVDADNDWVRGFCTRLLRAALGAGDRPPAPSDALEKLAAHWYGCADVAGKYGIEGRTFVACADRLLAALRSVRPTPRAALPDVDHMLELADEYLRLGPHTLTEAFNRSPTDYVRGFACWLELRLGGAASPAAAPPQEEPHE